MLLRVYGVFIDSGRGDNIKYSSLSAVSLQTSGELQRYFVSSVWIDVPMGDIRIHIPIDYTTYFDVQSSNSTVFYCYIIVTCRR